MRRKSHKQGFDNPRNKALKLFLTEEERKELREFADYLEMSASMYLFNLWKDDKRFITYQQQKRLKK